MNTYRLFTEDGHAYLVSASTSGVAIVKAERVLGRKVNAWEVATGRTRHDRDLPDTSWVRSTWVFARD